MMLRGLYTIARDCPFLSELARGIVAAYADADPALLARVTIMLPSRRAVRTLREAFLQMAESKALLLPKLITIGDIESDELQLAGLGLGSHLADLPPVIEGLERQWMLSEFLCRRDDTLSRAQALRQASQLAQLFDQLETFGKTPDDLHSMIEDRELASHWEETLQFLSIITEAWPNYLAATTQSDPAIYRRAVLTAQAEQWRQRPPQDPVIIAGISRAEPAIIDLMQAALALPQGAVVLPGFDRALDPESWAAIDAVHPDYLLKDLLEKIPAVRADVQTWPGEESARPARAQWLREAMRPVEGTAEWYQLLDKPLPEDVLDGIELVTCATEQEEAQSIALIMRETLERDDCTVSLVTPDRHLARLVAGQLKRWNIMVDDSAGIPLTRTSLGIFLLLVVAGCGPDASVFDGLALAKHPRLQMGREAGAAHADFRDLERLILRETFISPTLESWQQALSDQRIRVEASERTRLQQFFDEWLAMLAPLREALADGEREFALADLADLHLQVAEQLAATAEFSGAEMLWQGEEGVCAATFFYNARSTIGDMKIKASDYADLLVTWLTPLNVRTPYDKHPRATIHGLIEARLQQADVMILGGLNEGIWPQLPPANPFLSRRMMHDLDLPDPESMIAQGAHDFVSGASAPKVYLTRAARVGGAPTVPARWLLRMNAVLTNAAMAALWLQSGQRWPQLAVLMDKPASEIKSLAAPAPTPPLDARPRRLSVTQVEQWLRDPYGIYARKILGLRRLQKLQTLPTDAQRGQLVHAVLEEFTKQTLNKPKLFPADLDRLLKIGESELERYAGQPEIHILWRSYLDQVARWFIGTEQEARGEAVPIAVEADGRANFIFGGQPFTLTARADRIDRDTADQIRLIDYKTGTAPSVAQMQNGRAAQLALEALIADQGGFGQSNSRTGGVAYWQTPSRLGSGKIVKPSDEQLDAMIIAAGAALEALVTAFDKVTTAYLPVPLPDRAPRYNDYAHLERILEWAFAEGEDGEAGEEAYG